MFANLDCSVETNWVRWVANSIISLRVNLLMMIQSDVNAPTCLILEKSRDPTTLSEVACELRFSQIAMYTYKSLAMAKSK